MTDIKTLEDVLHRERLKADEEHVGIPSWERQFGELADKLGHGDLKRKNHKNITEYNQLRKLQREDELAGMRLYHLKRAKNTLTIGLMYPLALLILLFVIFNL